MLFELKINYIRSMGETETAQRSSSSAPASGRE